MTRFKHRISGPIDPKIKDESITLLLDQELEEDDQTRFLERGKKLILDSRAALWTTIDVLKRFPGGTQTERDAVKDACKQFFVLPTSALDEWGDQQHPKSPRELSLMLQVLAKTLNGLIGSQYMKVGDISATSGRNTIGQVSLRDAATSKKTKPYHNIVKSLPESGTKSGSTEVTHHRIGAITVSSLYFFSDDDLHGGLVTVIHEATHKFAGTLDEFYITESFMKQRNDPTYKGKSLKSAIVNADSYANLAATLHRAA